MTTQRDRTREQQTVKTVIKGTAATIAIIAVAATGPVQAFVEQPPIAEMGPFQVRDCPAGDTMLVPIRTSGADIVTLYANGYQLETAPGAPFDDHGLRVRLSLNNDVLAQLRAYLACESPFLRGTQGMLNLLADVTEADPRTAMVAIYQHAWSNGGDALVVRPGIETPADLSGAVIVTQRYGPHLGYMARVLADARRSAEADGQTWQPPEIRYVPELVGLFSDTPARSFLEDDTVTAAFVPMSDAQVLTSGGTGTGAEGSVGGARTLVSTTSANRVVSEVYAVRTDYLDVNRDAVQDFVRALLEAEETVREDVIKLIVDWEAVGEHLLADPQAEEDAQELWRSVETTGLQGNVDWANDAHPRSFLAVNNETQSVFVELGLLSRAHILANAGWTYDAFGEGLFDQRRTALPGFDDQAAAEAVDALRTNEAIDERTLFEFEIRFQPNQSEFPPADYREEFDQVIEFATTYGGAVLSVEGHSDPLRYLRRQQEQASSSELRRIRQAARNLSLSRAMAVRDVVLDVAEQRNVSMDESQFVTAGLGILDPRTGLCGDDPCPPQTEAEWQSNMRVVFRVIQMEAEAAVFTPLNTW